MRKYLLLTLLTLAFLSCEEEIPVYTVTVSSSPSEGGSVSPQGGDDVRPWSCLVPNRCMVNSIHMYRPIVCGVGAITSTNMILPSELANNPNFTKKELPL